MVESNPGRELTSTIIAATLVDGQEGRLGRQHRKQVHQLDDEVRQHLLVVVHVRCNQVALCTRITVTVKGGLHNAEACTVQLFA